MSDRMFLKRLTRRSFLAGLGATAALPILAACEPQIVEKKVEVPVVVKETVLVEKVVEKEMVVEKAVEVEKEVIVEKEKVVEREVVVEKLGRREVKVRYVSSGVDDGERIKAMVGLHNEVSDTTRLNLEVEVSSDWKAQYRTALGSGNPPDFIFMFGQPRWFPPLIENNLIVHLGEYAKQYAWKERFQEFLWEATQFNSKGYQVPMTGVTFPFVWYNKTLFDELELEVPANRIPSMDQLTGYVDAVKGAGWEPIALGNKSRWPGAHLLAVIGHRLVDTETLAKLRWACQEDTGVKWTGPEGQRILQTVADWAKMGLFAKGINAIDNGEAEDLFASGNAAGYSTGVWGAANIVKKAPEFEFGVFHYPQVDPSIPFVQMLLPAQAFAISTKSKFADELAALLDVTIQKEGQKRLVEQWGQFPSTILLKGEENIKYVHPTYGQLAADSATYPSEFFHPEGDCLEEFVNPFITDLQNLFDGTRTPMEVGEGMEQSAARIIRRAG